MSFSLVMLPGEPIVIITLTPEFDVAHDTPQVVTAFHEAMNATAEDVALIADFRAAKGQLSLENVVKGANLATKGGAGLFTHPQVARVIFVASSAIMKMAARGLSSAAFGRVNAQAASTVDEALMMARGG